nr:MAG TPA: hypothetical protein [Caudoviricetes sp.]DAY17185.1 MAG TPA: hypothetical protein [Caudoviricetes sp.]
MGNSVWQHRCCHCLGNQSPATNGGGKEKSRRYL